MLPIEKTQEQKLEERLAASRAAGMDDCILNIYQSRWDHRCPLQP